LSGIALNKDLWHRFGTICLAEPSFTASYLREHLRLSQIVTLPTQQYDCHSAAIFSRFAALTMQHKPQSTIIIQYCSVNTPCKTTHMPIQRSYVHPYAHMHAFTHIPHTHHITQFLLIQSWWHPQSQCSNARHLLYGMQFCVNGGTVELQSMHKCTCTHTRSHVCTGTYAHICAHIYVQSSHTVKQLIINT
jgi:hypothetical protein